MDPALVPPVDVLPALPDAAPAEDEAVGASSTVEKASPFSSLYKTESGTYAAIFTGLVMVVLVQIAVARIFGRAKTMVEALTYFATSTVAVLVAVFLCDLLIAGPDVLLLREGERADIVGFVKDTCLMVFAYFFGTKSVNPRPTDANLPPSE